MEEILTPIATVLAGILAAYFSSRFYTKQAKTDLKKEFESRLNQQKWDIYTEFTDIVRQVLQAGKDKTLDRKQAQLFSKLMEVVSKFWLVGSDEVIHAYTEWQRYSQAIQNQQIQGDPAETLLVKLMDIVIAMRKDLGYETSKVSSQSLLGTFIRDYQSNSQK